MTQQTLLIEKIGRAIHRLRYRTRPINDPEAKFSAHFLKKGEIEGKPKPGTGTACGNGVAVEILKSRISHRHLEKPRKNRARLSHISTSPAMIIFFDSKEGKIRFLFDRSHPLRK